MNPSIPAARIDLSAQTRLSHLRRLVLLRSIAIAAQCVILALVHYFLAIDLEWAPTLATIAMLALLNLLTWWRSRAAYPVSNPELFAQLCADVLVQTLRKVAGCLHRTATSERLSEISLRSCPKRMPR